MSATADEVKACCATVYSSAAARFLLGDHFHPGGAELTSHLIRALRVGMGDEIVDVASGRGASAIQAAREFSCRVVGVELSSASVTASAAAASHAGVAGLVRFVVGDAEALPLGDASADGVLCECALCTFPNKAVATAEFARVLRPGARLAISDITARPDALPAELSGLAARVACIADARPLEEITELVCSAGFTVESMECHDTALDVMLERVEARIGVAKIFGGAAGLEERLDEVTRIVAAARSATTDGTLGYASLIAQRP